MQGRSGDRSVSPAPLLPSASAILGVQILKLDFDQLLAARLDPLAVLATTARVVERARFVRIEPRALERAADTLAQRRVEPPTWNYDLHFFDGAERTVNYLFLLDALNFCFWEPRARWTIEYRGKKLDGYWALAAALKHAAEKNPRVLDADYWARISPAELAEILRGRGEIPLFAERWRNVRELGAGLCNHWGASAAQFVASAHGDAARLVQMLAENFASFNDVAVYRMPDPESGRRRDAETKSPRPRVPAPVHFFKRAQILVADLYGAFDGKQWGAFHNLATLTAFADYKLPQILRAWGVLRYAPALARKIDAQRELAAGGAEEIEIRAVTLWAVEFLREAFVRRGRAWMSIQVDWILWEAAQVRVKAMKPYHRVRTVYY